MFRKPSDLKPLPVSAQEFSEIREDGLFYVDKTDLVWQTATGRIDLVCRYDTCILVVELKMTDNGGLAAAKRQIADRAYLAPYMAQSKPIYAVALEFDAKQRCMTRYKVTKVN